MPSGSSTPTGDSVEVEATGADHGELRTVLLTRAAAYFGLDITSDRLTITAFHAHVVGMDMDGSPSRYRTKARVYLRDENEVRRERDHGDASVPPRAPRPVGPDVEEDEDEDDFDEATDVIGDGE